MKKDNTKTITCSEFKDLIDSKNVSFIAFDSDSDDLELMARFNRVELTDNPRSIIFRGISCSMKIHNIVKLFVSAKDLYLDILFETDDGRYKFVALL